MTLKTKTINRPGFTAVEVMIALVVASVFLFSGYQLFAAVYQSHLVARIKAQAANIAQAHLRERANESFYCGTSVSYKKHKPYQHEDLKDLKIETWVTCPYGNSQKLIMARIVVEYTINGVKQTEEQAIYVDKS